MAITSITFHMNTWWGFVLCDEATSWQPLVRPYPWLSYQCAKFEDFSRNYSISARADHKKTSVSKKSQFYFNVSLCYHKQKQPVSKYNSCHKFCIPYLILKNELDFLKS